jgi:eukaryotic-like serine/threonine-protein kinase
MGIEGSTFGPYELVRRLGAGGMAETFLAVRHGPGGFEQRVCLKRILPAFEEDEGFVRQFLHEARLSAKLRHAHIAQVIDFGVHEGSHYLALELVDGLDLRGLLKAQRRADDRVPPDVAALVALDMASALEHAAAQGVVHRDISPSNVLLSTTGEIKLTDFGIARAMDQPGVTRTGVIKGKVPYMAPEYVNHGALDARSDLFGLGVVLFECLAGRRPYDGMTDLETVGRASMGEHPPLAELAPDAPAVLVDAVERLIRPSPDERFASASELHDAIAEVAPPPQARRRLGALVQRCLAPAPEPPQITGDPELATTEPGKRAPVAHTRTELLPDAVHAPPGETPDRPPQTSGPNDPTRTMHATAVAEETAETPVPKAAPRRRFPAHRRVVMALALTALATLGVRATVLQPAGHGEGTRDPSPASSAEGDAAAAPQASATREATDDGDRLAERSAASGEAPPAASAGPADGPTDEQGIPDDDRPEAAAEDETRSDPDAADRKRTAPPPAMLHVVVLPFGDVWIDGRHVGPSPARVRIRPGSHTVATGDGAPERSTRVQVAAGEQRRVVLD